MLADSDYANARDVRGGRMALTYTLVLCQTMRVSKCLSATRKAHGSNENTNGLARAL